MTNQLICSRSVQEEIIISWHHHPGLYSYTMPADARAWLESDEMQGRWYCTIGATYNKAGVYFENQEDLVMYKMKWG